MYNEHHDTCIKYITIYLEVSTHLHQVEHIITYNKYSFFIL
jgi:hypothetical protein